MTLRRAQAADEPAIAWLHADSWRTAYRGILRDDFLDGALAANRRRLWSGRFCEINREDQLIILSEELGEIRGFACAFLDADPEWGTLVDNLHVIPGLKGRGLGRQLMDRQWRWKSNGVGFIRCCTFGCTSKTFRRVVSTNGWAASSPPALPKRRRTAAG